MLFAADCPTSRHSKPLDSRCLDQSKEFLFDLSYAKKHAGTIRLSSSTPFVTATAPWHSSLGSFFPELSKTLPQMSIVCKPNWDKLPCGVRNLKVLKVWGKCHHPSPFLWNRSNCLRGATLTSANSPYTCLRKLRTHNLKVVKQIGHVSLVWT